MRTECKHLLLVSLLAVGQSLPFLKLNHLSSESVNNCELPEYKLQEREKKKRIYKSPKSLIDHSNYQLKKMCVHQILFFPSCDC